MNDSKKNTSHTKKTSVRPIQTTRPQKPKISTYVRQTTNGQQAYSKNGRKAYVYKMDENNRRKKYRVYQGSRGGFLFKRGGKDVKLNHINGFVYEK